MSNDQAIDLTLASMEVDISFLNQQNLEPEQIEKLLELRERLNSLIFSQTIASPSTDFDVDIIFALM